MPNRNSSGAYLPFSSDHPLRLLLLGRQQLETRMYRQRLLHQGIELRHLLIDEELGVGLGLLELEHVAKGQLGDLQAAPCLLGIDARSVIGRLGGGRSTRAIWPWASSFLACSRWWDSPCSISCLVCTTWAASTTPK